MSREAKPRRQIERENRRVELIGHATRLFAERGIENVTFGHIAEAAGMSRTLVYFYFPDQETLVAEALEMALRDLHQRFIATVRPKDTGIVQIREISRAYVRFHEENPGAFGLLAICQAKREEAGAKRSATEDAVDSHHRSIMEILVAAVEKGRRDGTVRKDSVPAIDIAFCMWAMTHGLIELRATKGEKIVESLGPGADAFVETGINLLLKSLQTKSS